jgi:UDP-sugar transporter A1/2/3
MLVIGVSLISVNSVPKGGSSKAHGLVNMFGREYLIGIGCALIQTVLSGFGSVYFEAVLKDKTAAEPFNVWDRNIQLAFYSIIIYLPSAYTQTNGDILAGFTPLVRTTRTLLQASLLAAASLCAPCVRTILDITSEMLHCYFNLPV